ncbi:MAG: hypothetical protein HYV32_05245 [Candidatus Kerfeldbacteria bacterium]|nr:hypothetical protein [Candidatus Kerfeldbacteria bacterium]
MSNQQAEQRQCQNCAQEFTVEPEDFVFYEKIQVPAPTWCADCRNRRRFAWRNERVLYSRTCDLCNKQIISTYSADSPYTIYCPTCWWSDKWDAATFARAIDFSRPFFEQFQELLLAVPRISLVNLKSENSEFCNEVENIVDSYLAIFSFSSQRLYYTYWTSASNDCIDCSFTLNSQLCYDSQDITHCYNSRFIYNSTHITDSLFLYNCHNSSNCFQCVNLKNAEYCIRNVQYTKEEYFQKLQLFNFSDTQTIEKLQKEFWEYTEQIPRHEISIRTSENISGNYLQHCNNVRKSFDTIDANNCAYISDSGGIVDSMDCDQVGMNCELLYEIQNGARLYNIAFAHACRDLRDSQYVDSCHSTENLFGCAGLRKKKYAILNKEYTPEEFAMLKEKLIAHMKQTGEWGEFFPMHLSPYAYNESTVQQWYPKTKTEVEAEGLRWKKDLPGTYRKETIQWSDMPDTISDVSADVTKHVFACIDCQKNFKITQPEFAFYQKHTIPIPRRCADCRFQKRLSHRDPRKLWKQTCQCAGSQSENGVYTNTATHDHADTLCSRTFQTAYAPDRKEIIYCKECYNAEII